MLNIENTWEWDSIGWYYNANESKLTRSVKCKTVKDSLYFHYSASATFEYTVKTDSLFTVSSDGKVEIPNLTNVSNGGAAPMMDIAEEIAWLKARVIGMATSGGGSGIGVSYFTQSDVSDIP
jgi:hypothetical protein